MSVIVYELNEVPVKLFDFYAKAFPRSAFAKLRNDGIRFQTLTADMGSLSPWITWPTMHRGVSNVHHEISDLGQDLTKTNKDFPNLFEFLTRQNVKVGVFGSLQSYPLPENLENYSFYVPDTFAAGDECFPKELSAFQAFNLSMVRASGRNVSKGIAVRDAAKFIANARRLGLESRTFYNLAQQVFSERMNKDRVVRRRTSQIEIAFDLYFKQLSQTKPDISFFFTNHVASSMHRYWPTIFPEDYEEGRFDKSWCKQWQEEIPHAVKVANYQLEKLIAYCARTGSELIVSSSMGQGAVEDATPVDRQALITKVSKLMRYLGVPDTDWEPRLGMAPRVVIQPKNDTVVHKIARLDKILINGTKIEHFITSTGDIRLEILLTNVDRLEVVDGNTPISGADIGVEIVDLQDASGAYAYHIPQGILLHYDPAKPSKQPQNDGWKEVSALDFAPSILRKFNVQTPGHMTGDNKVFQPAG